MKAVKMRVTESVSAQDIKKHLEGLGYLWMSKLAFHEDEMFWLGEPVRKSILYFSCAEDFIISPAQEIFLPSEATQQMADKSPVVSDGLSTSYYKLTITNKAGESIDCEMGDVIRCVVGDNFSLGNVYKAARRMYEASLGRGKKDVSMSYDANKIAYFSKEFADWYEGKV